MIKMIYCLRRLPSLSLEEFQSHWREHHALYGRRIKRLLRYVQYHPLVDDPVRAAMAQAAEGHIEPYDGFTISWWESREEMEKAFVEESGVAEALEDEKLFIDHSRSVACVTEEHVIVEPQGDVPIVLIECLRRRSDIDRAAFSKMWLEHSPIGRRAHAMGLLMGYIQNHTFLGDAGRLPGLGADEEPWDGVVTAYFESVAKLKALLTSPLAAEESFEDEKKFIDHGRTVYAVTRRQVMKDLVR